MMRWSVCAKFLVGVLLSEALLFIPAGTAARSGAVALAPADCLGSERYREELEPYAAPEPDEGEQSEPTPTPEKFEVPAYRKPPDGATDKADATTIEAVTVIAGGMIDCYNAQDAARMLAFFSPEFFKLLYQELGPLSRERLDELPLKENATLGEASFARMLVALQEDESQAELISVDEVYFLEDGRVGALVTLRDPVMAAELRTDEFPATDDLLTYSTILGPSDNEHKYQFDYFMIVDPNSEVVDVDGTPSSMRVRLSSLPSLLGVNYGGACFGNGGKWWQSGF